MRSKLNFMHELAIAWGTAVKGLWHAADLPLVRCPVCCCIVEAKDKDEHVEYHKTLMRMAS